MLLYECSRSGERLTVEGQDPPDPAPPGSFAATILQTVRPSRKQQDAAVTRLVSWLVRRLDEGHYRSYAKSADVLGLISTQLEEWSRRSRVRWSPAYSDLDPHEGPTSVLSTPDARRLLEAIEWRGPSVVRVTVPEAAVLLSGLYGMTRGTLVCCVGCHRLVTVLNRQAKRQQCPHCGARRRSAAESVIREYELAYDRVRKVYRSRPDDRARLSGELSRIREANRSGRLSAQAAVEQIRTLVPCGPRGRPRVQRQRVA
jgi:hypothetical protein